MGTRRRSRRAARLVAGVALSALAVALGLGACTLDSAGQGPAGGGEGGQNPCSTCPGADTDCTYRTCDGGECAVAYALGGTPCDEDGGQVCDGAGTCVECVDPSQCGAQEACVINLCVPGECVDGLQNGDETDVDCGGGICVPCANGLDCVNAEDCVSSVCHGNVCQPCTTGDDCPPGDYCNQAGVCLLLREVGSPCGLDEACSSGFCPPEDGICCSSACSGTCESCQASKTGGTDGTCALIPDGDDPDGECGAQPAASCDANGTGCHGSAPACHLYPPGFVCQEATCTAGQLTSVGICDGDGLCEANLTMSCHPYACNGSVCFTSCTTSIQCAPGYDCSTSSDCRLGPGAICGGDDQCASGSCRGQRCCATSCSGLCKSCKGLDTIGGVDGVCDDIKPNTDPYDECSGSNDCDGSGCE